MLQFPNFFLQPPLLLGCDFGDLFQRLFVHDAPDLLQ